MIAKRVLDLAGAAIGLLVLAPLFAAAALWIKLDSSGPVFFRQTRVGRFGKPFRILKFRSMRVDGGGPSLTVGADRRITRAGAVLRRFKLDELPQLVNVLRGEMSLVGPRPEVPEYVAHYTDEQRVRVLSVRPGVTDPASIAFVNESEVLGRAADPHRAYIDEILPVKLRLYQEYVSTRSFAGDLSIILETLAVSLFGVRPRRG